MLQSATAAPVITTAGAALLQESCITNNGAIDPGETVTLDFSLRNTGTSNTTNLVATLLVTNGVISPSAPQTYGILTAGGATVARSFTFTASGPCGSTVSPTFQLQDGSNNLGTVSFNFQLGPTVLIFSESFDGVTPTNLPAGWTASLVGIGTIWNTTTNARDTVPNSAFSPDPSGRGTNRLTSPSIAITSDASQLTFRHNYNTEAGADGGILEISIAGGAFTNITNVGGAFVTGGYNGTILFGSVPAWTGSSGGFVTTTVNLPASAAGKNIQLRWRFTSDSSGSGVGWYVDTVSVSEVRCCSSAGTADLALTASDAPDPIVVDNTLTYSLRVTNRGPATATGVKLTNTLPAGVSFVSATSTQGSCTNVAGIITCSLGTLTNNAGATVTISVTPTNAGTLTNVTVVTANEPDFNSLNNSAALVTTVTLPSLSIDDPTVTEGNTGTVNAVFTVQLSPASSRTVSVAFATDDVTAVAPGDYVSTNGTLIFNPGQTSKTIVVAVRGDTLSEDDETFDINLFNPTNAMLVKAQGECTIFDNDPLPLLSISNTSVTEGNSGTTNAVFTVTLSPASGQLVYVDFTTSNGTAIAGSDYVASDDTLVFSPGETVQTISVPVIGDTFNESNETFFVNLLNPQNATLGSAQAVGTIINDDPLPALSINDVTLYHGSSGTTNAVFTVTLAPPSGQFVSVGFQTADGSATAGTDYFATNGVLSFAPGQTNQTFSVAVIGNTLNNSNRTFLVNLLNPVAATLGRGQGVGTILSPPPGLLTVAPASHDFGVLALGGATNFTFVISNAGGSPLTGTASVAPGPFAILSGTPFSVDSHASTNLVVRFAPTNEGNFNAALVITSDGGSSTNSLNGAGAAPPLAQFGASSTNGFAPLPVTFNDSSTGTITNRFWDFGDGSSTNTTSTNVMHTYGAPGTNTVTLTVSGPLGTSSLARTNFIVVESHGLEIEAVEIGGDDLIVKVRTLADRHYQLERTDDIDGGTWTLVGDSVMGTGGVVPLVDPGGAAPQSRFYHVRELP
ncbi:MAG TPA: Calx-beta domain-containing protein [Verrucomicrobiae bacterium]